MLFNSQSINDYVLLYPAFSLNGLQSARPQTNNMQILHGIEPTEQSENSSTDDDTDETNEGSDESYEESDENEEGNEGGSEDGGGDGDEDEDVGEETGTDFWQSLIDYFGICEGSNKAIRTAILSRIKADRLAIKAN